MLIYSNIALSYGEIVSYFASPLQRQIWKILVFSLNCLLNWSLESFSQDYGPVFHISHIVLILFITSGTYSLKSISMKIFLRNFSWQFLFTFRFFVRTLKVREIFFILFEPGLEPEFIMVVSQNFNLDSISTHLRLVIARLFNLRAFF